MLPQKVPADGISSFTPATTGDQFVEKLPLVSVVPLIRISIAHVNGYGQSPGADAYSVVSSVIVEADHAVRKDNFSSPTSQSSIVCSPLRGAKYVTHTSDDRSPLLPLTCLARESSQPSTGTSDTSAASDFVACLLELITQGRVLYKSPLPLCRGARQQVHWRILHALVHMREVCLLAIIR